MLIQLRNRWSFNYFVPKFVEEIFLISRLWFQNFAFTCFSRPASNGKAAIRIIREYADSTKIGDAVALSSFLVAKIKMSVAKENGGRKHKIQFAG